jgi:hypothetical protein
MLEMSRRRSRPNAPTQSQSGGEVDTQASLFLFFIARIVVATLFILVASSAVIFLDMLLTGSNVEVFPELTDAVEETLSILAIAIGAK